MGVEVTSRKPGGEADYAQADAPGPYVVTKTNLTTTFSLLCSK
jgi:hypothetical protein